MLKLCLIFIIGVWFGNIMNEIGIQKFNKYVNDKNLNLKIHKSIYDDGVVLHFCTNYYSCNRMKRRLCFSIPFIIYSNYLQFIYEEFGIII